MAVNVNRRAFLTVSTPKKRFATKMSYFAHTCETFSNDPLSNEEKVKTNAVQACGKKGNKVYQSMFALFMDDAVINQEGSARIDLTTLDEEWDAPFCFAPASFVSPRPTTRASSLFSTENLGKVRRMRPPRLRGGPPFRRGEAV